MNKQLKAFTDAIDKPLSDLKNHLDTTTYADADIKDLRKWVKDSEKTLKRIRLIDRLGNMKLHPALARLPAPTPVKNLRKGLGYVIRVDANTVYIMKMEITNIFFRDDDVLVSYVGKPPFYESERSAPTLFHGKYRDTYFVQIPEGKNSIPGFPVGIFKRH